MCDFVLIDLYSQRETACRYVATWTKDEILNWMQCYGSVEILWVDRLIVGDVASDSNLLPQRYVFVPNCCYDLRAVFLFEGNNLIIPNWGRL